MVEPDPRFRSVPDLVAYLCDQLDLNMTELARRCGVRPEQLSRWSNGVAEPRLASLRAALEPLGWRPVIALEPTCPVPDEVPDMSFLLGDRVREVLLTAAIAADEGQDVVVGGEAAAVLQGVPLRTRHLVLYVRAEHLPGLSAVAARRRQRIVVRAAGEPARLYCGGLGAELRFAAVRPPTRLVRPRHHAFDGLAVPVVDLAALLAEDPDDSAGLGPDARAVAGRFAERERTPTRAH